MSSWFKNLYLKSNLRILSRIIEPIGNNILNSDVKNIHRWSQKKAVEETANFVNENMMNVKSFSNKFYLLNFAITCVKNKDGLFLEFGVYRGKTVNYIAKINPNINIYGFDSFEGIQEDWNYLSKGAFKLIQLPKVRKNVTLIKGWFHETIPIFKQKEKNYISFLHIDCDLYSSTATIFTEFCNQITNDTIIVFDEYFNYPGWKAGEYKAFIEFVNKNQIQYEFIGYCFKGEQVAVKIISKNEKS